jgi:hypothetical protein
LHAAVENSRGIFDLLGKAGGPKQQRSEDRPSLLSVWIALSAKRADQALTAAGMAHSTPVPRRPH